MSVSPSDVLRMARLAHLHLNPEEVEPLTDQLNRILSHVAELAQVGQPVADAAPGVSEVPAPLRADMPGADPLWSPPSALSAFFEAGFFSVPRLAALDGEAE